jgi:hypothetical protein
MRFLKTQTLNRRALYDSRVALDTSNNFTVADSTVMTLPKSSSSITSPMTGMVRYNTSTNEVEVYQGSSATWRAIRYKEPAKITQQNLGAGDGVEVYFGPISPSPASYTSTASGMTWDVVQIAKNMLVVVENVLQLSSVNYTVVQNPTIGAETYSPVTSASASSSATTLYFNSSLVATGASGNGTTVILTFNTRPAAPFSVGSSIVVTGFTPSGYNGTYTVTASSATTVSYTNSTTATMTVAGQVASTTAVYPSANFTGSIITGSGSLQASTAITAFVIDADTDALVSATFVGKATTGTIAANVTLTITESSGTGSGYYLKFSSPVPNGKIVTALIGFDQ